MKKRIIYIILFLLVSELSFGQKKTKRITEDNFNAVYKKEWGVGLRFHTNGFSTFFEHVWIKDIKKRKLIQVNFFALSDFRERKIGTIYNSDPRSHKYHYAKINNFYSFNLLYGYRRVIANKSETSGVKLSFTYMGGLSLGFLKPYYLRFIDSDASNLRTYDEGYTEQNAAMFLDSNPTSSLVFGAAGIGKGFNMLSFLPGLQAKVGLNFDFARKNNIVTSIEVGSQIDVFYKKINTYLSDRNKPYILNLYLSAQIGKRN